MCIQSCLEDRVRWERARKAMAGKFQTSNLDADMCHKNLWRCPQLMMSRLSMTHAFVKVHENDRLIIAHVNISSGNSPQKNRVKCVAKGWMRKRCVKESVNGVYLFVAWKVINGLVNEHLLFWMCWHETSDCVGPRSRWRCWGSLHRSGTIASIWSGKRRSSDRPILS